MEEREVGTCVAVILINSEGKVLVGQRKNVRGDGLYQLPGGRQRVNENFTDALRRELKEEAGNLEIKVVDENFPFATVSESFDGKSRYTVVFMRAKYLSGNIENVEDTKNVSWGWYDWNKLPQPLFSGIQYLVDKGRNPISEPAII